MKYRKLAGYKYAVAEDVRYDLPTFEGVSFSHAFFDMRDGELTVREGYSWDGASGPTIDSAATMSGSLVHDVLYQAMRGNLLPAESRSVADAALRDLMISKGASRIRSYTWYFALRAFGAKNVESRDYEPIEKIYEAP